MLAFIFSVICFIISLSLKSTIFIVKTDLKRMERKGKVKSGKLNNVVDKIRSKRRDKKDKSDVRNTTSYKIKKRLLALLKSLLLMVKSVTILSIIITILVIIVVFLFIIILLVAMAGIIMVLSSDGGKNSINNILTSSNSNTGNNKKVEKVADIDGWLDACQRTWTHNRNKGYNYVKAIKKDKEYGLIRLDCSGYAWQCLSEFGSVKKPNKGDIPTSSSFASSSKK